MKRVFLKNCRLPLVRLLCIVALLTSACSSNASHLIGGGLTYECLGNGDYNIQLKIYRDCHCTNCADFDDPAYIFIYNNGTLVHTLTLPFPGATQLPVTVNDLCLSTSDICVEEAIYSANINLFPMGGGWDLVYQRCCRNSTILNLFNPGSTGSTYYAHIPDPGIVSPSIFCNSNPYFNHFPPIGLCVGDTLAFDHSATDIDGDSLVYKLCIPYSGASQSNPMPVPAAPPPPPPYSTVFYVSPYSIYNPLNGVPPLTIDPQTGKIYGAPSTIGQFVVGVCVEEYRDGILLSTNKRDFQFNVVHCDSVALPTPATIINNGTSLVAYPDSVLYQWLNCDNNFAPINGAINQSFIPSANGNYCVVINDNGCVDTSSCLGFIVSSWDCVNNNCIDPGSGMGIYSTLAECQAACDSTTTSIKEAIGSKELLYITDILGRTTHPAPNRVLFYLYDDGSVEKKIRLER